MNNEQIIEEVISYMKKNSPKDNGLFCYELVHAGIKKALILKEEELKKINLEPWQGKDKLQYTKEGSDWVITEHRKDRESGEVAYITHTIKQTDLVEVWRCIQTRIDIGEKTTSKKIGLDIIQKKRLPISIDELWGGKNRNLYLFPLVYYPLKILQEKKYIRYNGRGGIVRLK